MFLFPSFIPRKWKLLFLTVSFSLLLLLSAHFYHSESYNQSATSPLSIVSNSEIHSHLSGNNTASYFSSKPSYFSNFSFIVLVKLSSESSILIDIFDHLLVEYHVLKLYGPYRWNQSKLLESLEELRIIPSLIVFEEFAVYTILSSTQKLALNNYCRRNRIGVIGFLNDGHAFSTEDDSLTLLGDLPVYIHRLGEYPWGFYLAHHAPMFRVTRGGRMEPGLLRDTSCCLATLIPRPGYESQFVTAAFTRINHVGKSKNPNDVRSRSCVTSSPEEDRNSVFQSLVLQDLGLTDGVRRVLFATRPGGLWANSLLLFDAIVHLLGAHSSPPISSPLTPEFSGLKSYLSENGVTTPHDLIRWVMVDIDDVFMRGTSTDFTVEDANALLHTQHIWREHIPGFRFNLGFCGRFFDHATRPDLRGYAKLLELRHQFRWFDHLWNHLQPHKLNETELVDYVRQNQRFAQHHDIPVSSCYAISPHHSGVYPVVPSLYHVWRTVLNISVTSTTLYSSTATYSFRKGFRYDGIQVLPRQSCGVYSRFVRLVDFPGGEAAMRKLVFGGNLFRVLLFNPVSIFMTHMTNYKGDRLASLVLDAAFRFVREWTNLQLVSASPSQLAHFYADRFAPLGVNELPLFQDPCSNPHLHELWPEHWPCGHARLPHFIILGPQKTGSTALVHFLRLHASLSPSHYQPHSTFEELQFFSSDAIYSKGVHWYMEQFTPSTDLVRFEKSATYFASSKAPKRVHALIPTVRLVIILANPVRRAFSWYQHMLAHNDTAARVLSFSDLIRFGSNITANHLLRITAPDTLNRLGIDRENSSAVEHLLASVRHLYAGVIQPGQYANHLVRWLNLFGSANILLVDGEHFVQNPAASLNVLQDFLQLRSRLNYSEYLSYDPAKKFFCVRPGVSFPTRDYDPPHLSRCLGSGKGRNYRPLSEHSEVVLDLLRARFERSNTQLRDLLSAHANLRRWLFDATGNEFPAWLSSDNS